MAIVTDNLNYSASYTPFERPPEAFTLSSLVPRGLRRFFLDSATSAKPQTDSHSIFVTATLPDAFAYILVRFNLNLSVDRALDYQDSLLTRLFNHIPGQPLGSFELINLPFQFFQRVGESSRYSRNQGELSSFVGPMWSTHQGAITFRVELSNNNVSTAAGVGFVGSHVEFLEYDLVQAQRYWINTPIPVLQR